MSNKNVIIKVENDSIAYELGIEVGDILLDINGKAISDVFDYRYMIQDEYVEIGILKPNGEEWTLEIEKDEYEDLGIVFEKGLMDKAKSCSNKCIFCFIDQLPKGMRDTLYFKDDDSRLSFLQGNYVTLTNMKQEDIDRIIFYHLSPINISVHTTDMDLRKKMLKNPNASKLMNYIEKIAASHIDMNFQVVLCNKINDGKQLDKTISDLSKFIPRGVSLSIVPVGITRYREGLYPFEPFTKQDAQNIIKQVTQWQEKLKEQYGTRFVYISDEFYLTAEMKFPSYDEYEGFPQIENGVGMISSMKYEFCEYIKNVKGDNISRHVSMATGKAAYNFICNLAREIESKFINTKIDIYCIENEFFGGKITVSGLLTAQDIINQLKDKDLGEKLFIPKSALRSNDIVFLDDLSIEDVERELNIKVKASDNEGSQFIKQIICTEE